MNNMNDRIKLALCGIIITLISAFSFFEVIGRLAYKSQHYTFRLPWSSFEWGILLCGTLTILGLVIGFMILIRTALYTHQAEQQKNDAVLQAAEKELHSLSVNSSS